MGIHEPYEFEPKNDDIVEELLQCDDMTEWTHKILNHYNKLGLSPDDSHVFMLELTSFMDAVRLILIERHERDARESRHTQEAV